MKLKLFDFIALGVSALGTVLMGLSTLRQARSSAIETIENAVFEAEETEDEE